jgi:putative transposase
VGAWLHPRREIPNAIFYGGPHRLPVAWVAPRIPPWSTAHYWFRLWRLDGTWERLNGALRERVFMTG